jgi:MFS family permease
MIAWGLISAATMFAWSVPAFCSLRFLLGAAEAGFFPGMIWYLGSWFPASARGRIFGMFYFGAPLAQIVGGPLSGLLLDLNGRGSLRGWQWMFLVEGALAIGVGAWACASMPGRMAEASWLSAGERGALQAELDAEERTKGSADAGGPRLSIFRGPVLRLGIVYALIQMSFYGVAFYLPSQVSGLLGRDIGFIVGLVSAIPWICALLAAYSIPLVAARTGRAGATAGASLAMGALGIAFSSSRHPGLGLAGLCLAAAGLIGAQPIFWTLPAGAFSGSAAAMGIALINSLGAVGGFLAPNLKVVAEGISGSPLAGSFTLAGATALAAILMLRLNPAVPGNQ